MTISRKLKVSLTLSADLLEAIDRNARREKDTRSGIVERWLRRFANATAVTEIDDATAAYYLAMNAAERADEQALARAMSRSARRVAKKRPTPRARSRR